MRLPFIVDRIERLGPALTVEFRVALSAALLWSPQYRHRERLLFASAASRAARDGRELLRDRGITRGCWRITWTGTRVEVESADDG